MHTETELKPFDPISSTLSFVFFSSSQKTEVGFALAFCDILGPGCAAKTNLSF